MKSFLAFRTSIILMAAFSLMNTVGGPALAADAATQPKHILVYFGTYTGAKSKGIYLSRLDLASGKLTPAELVGEASSPSFLAIHPNRKFLYAASEISNFNGQPTGAVAAFSIDAATGKLTALNQQTSGGSGPCHLVVDKAGKHVLVANYNGGSVEALSVQEDGRLGAPTAFIQHTGSGVNKQRQERPHAHSINLDAANRFAVVADLGLDKVLVYRFDTSKGTLVPNDPPSASLKPGAGPRHFAFHPSERNAYVINEMHCTVTAFAYDAAKGALAEIQTISTLPGEVQKGYSTAEVQVHLSGKFLYGSNRGHDTIAVFAIDSNTGKLTLVEHESTQGKTPRNFGIDPTGRYLLAANQGSSTVVVFRIDASTGALEPTGQSLDVPMAVCAKFLAQ